MIQFRQNVIHRVVFVSCEQKNTSFVNQIINKSLKNNIFFGQNLVIPATATQECLVANITFANVCKAKGHSKTRLETQVVPIAHKTMGSWAPDSLKFVQDLGSRISVKNGPSLSCSKA